LTRSELHSSFKISKLQIIIKSNISYIAGTEMEKPKNKLAGLDKTKSFKQKKKIQKGSRGYGLKQIARMTLGSGNM